MASCKKQVQVIARVSFKADRRKVCYLIRASNGVDQYTTYLFDGKACSCNCPAKGSCYHRKQLEQIEAARSASVVAAAPAIVEEAAITTTQVLDAVVSLVNAQMGAQVVRRGPATPAQTKDIASAPLHHNRGFSLLKTA